MTASLSLNSGRKPVAHQKDKYKEDKQINYLITGKSPVKERIRKNIRDKYPEQIRKKKDKKDKKAERINAKVRNG